MPSAKVNATVKYLYTSTGRGRILRSVSTYKGKSNFVTYITIVHMHNKIRYDINRIDPS
ncbi:hypothetical protein SAMN05661091_0154 [Paenibacillus uliginis N3/975]|uniref:Uncharacterized protein n=1 Tax=Paenibacillus uliginis N3/975 TaxID=1313296 RepID=A0A1X7G7C0_9BACL|nr:hypothetical protein SAMN05661091_0154 [Paenibacillus uliginis N3/975]